MYVRVPVISHPCQHLIESHIKMFASIVSLKYLRVVLICISLITVDIGHLVMHLLAICFLFCEGFM